MDLTLLDDNTLRTALPQFLATHIADSALTRSRNCATLTALVAGWSADDFSAFRALLPTIGEAYRVYPALETCRDAARTWCQDVITAADITGIDHLRAARATGPTVIVGNHLTYFDTTAADAALAWAGYDDVANSVVTAAGPKVYDTPFRRFASAGLNTLPVPQSTRLAGTASLSRRELAERAIQSLSANKALLRDGLSLQIYPEGTRTRSGRLGPFLRGVYRYVNVPGCTIVPLAQTGTDTIMPVGSEHLSPAPIRLQYGAPLRVDAHDDPRDALTAAWHAVAAMLPEHLRPEPGTAPLR